jgi:hypothetical protein
MRQQTKFGRYAMRTINDSFRRPLGGEVHLCSLAHTVSACSSGSQGRNRRVFGQKFAALKTVPRGRPSTHGGPGAKHHIASYRANGISKIEVRHVKGALSAETRSDHFLKGL